MIVSKVYSRGDIMAHSGGDSGDHSGGDSIAT